MLKALVMRPRAHEKVCATDLRLLLPLGEAASVVELRDVGASDMSCTGSAELQVTHHYCTEKVSSYL
jgi:hypothetical protein